MKSIVSLGISAALLGAASLAPAAEIDVMTQNQYLGADLAPALAAATASPFNADDFNAAVVNVLTKIAANRPADRARALAGQIAQRMPDVVGLQEAYKFACLPHPIVPEVPGMGCSDPAIKMAFTDHLLGIEAALQGQYRVVGRVTNLQIAAIPFSINGFPAILAFADRDAILVRKGLSAAPVDLTPTGTCAKPSEQGCNFQTAPGPMDTPIGPIAIERGFLAVDVKVRGRDYRVFNTHLEQRLLAPDLLETRLLQVGQAYELLGAAQATWDGSKTVIVIGDLNSAPGDTIPAPPYPAVLPPYQAFVSNGFTDAWTLRHGQEPGFTCCQAEDLMNHRSALSERIDIIFSLQRPAHVRQMKLLGDGPQDRIRQPRGLPWLWPSDHAAVAAVLHFD